MGRHFLTGCVLCVALWAAPATRIGGAGSLAEEPAQLMGVVSAGVGGNHEALPGVVVTATPEQGGPSVSATTDDKGSYQLVLVPEMTYRLDFDLQAFDVTRLHHVRVAAGHARVLDAELWISTVCECIDVGQSAYRRVVWRLLHLGRKPTPPRTPISGQVVDESGRPLPYARLGLAAQPSENALADQAGRFRLHLAGTETARLSASAEGFEAVTADIAAGESGPIVLTLRYVGAVDVPVVERLERGCQCGGPFDNHRP